jgi:hypothetical protein
VVQASRLHRQLNRLHVNRIPPSSPPAMSEPALRAACPSCNTLTRHALVPVPHVDLPPAPALGAAVKHRLVCTQCEKLWEGTMIPLEQLAQLQLAAESLVAAKRQIAMMRLILSKDQLARLEQDRRETIKLHRAA